MPDPQKAYTEIDIPDQTAQLLVMMGLARVDAEEHAPYLTEKGDVWLREWCEQKIAEHEAAASG